MTNEEKLDKLLDAATRIDTAVGDLKVRLYGEGADLGDIPGMARHLEQLNGFKGDCEKRVGVLEGKVRIILYILGTLLTIGGGTAGILKLLGDL